MCANVDQMCDRMCTKVLTTDNAVILLSQESAPEKTTTEIDTISGYHLGVLHGPRPLCGLYVLRFCQWLDFLNSGLNFLILF
jgi:hypothetical protein